MIDAWGQTVEIKVAPDHTGGHRVWVHSGPAGQLVLRVYQATLVLDGLHLVAPLPADVAATARAVRAAHCFTAESVKACKDAAALIERQAQEIARLRAALGEREPPS